MSEYWTPLRDEAGRYWQRVREQREAEERDRRAWIADVKRRMGIRCAGDENEAAAVPEWPVLPDGAAYTCVAEYAMASYDGVNFYVKPEGMPTAEWLASLPKPPARAPRRRRG
jgi:hypothetical protein